MRASMAFCEPLPSTIVVLSLVAVTRRAWPSMLRFTFSSLRPTSSEMTWPPVSTAMSCSISLRRSPKPGALMASALTVPRSLLTTRVARASPSTSSAMITTFLIARLHQLLQHGQDVGNGADLLVGDQDVGVLQDGFHAVRIRDHVRRDVAAVELHAVHVVLLQAQALRLLDGDDAVPADLAHDVS